MTTLTLSHPALVPGAPASLRSLWAGSRVLLVLVSLARLLARAVSRRPSVAAASAPAAPEPPRRSPARAPASVRPCQLVLF